jgi:Flp pilus assembly protein TadG
MIFSYHLLKRNNGQAMVETAFVLIFLVMFTFGITEFGRAMYIKNMLNNAARAAARVAVVTPSLSAPGTVPTYPAGTFTNGMNCAAITTDNVEQMICKSLFYVNFPDISASVSVTHTPPNTGGTAVTDDSVTVTVTNNNFSSLVPALFGPSGYVPFFPSSLNGTATMRYE